MSVAPLGVNEETARLYASWFRALSDPTRVQLLHVLAAERRPMSVGEIVERAPVGQSTVSHHLKILAEVRFVLSERSGTTIWYRVNTACLSCFPSAIRAILGDQEPACEGDRDER